MSTTEKRRVLVVEDEPSICRVIERVLGVQDFIVDVVPDGRSAGESIAARKYDLLLVDIRLPVRSGIEFYVGMQAQYPDLTKRVIFMTGSIMGGETLTFLEKTGQPFLLKPFRPDELMSVVNRLFDKS